MNTWINRTRFAIVLVVVGVILYDVIAAWFGGGDATVSTQITFMSRHFASGLAIPFGFGFLMGHFFGSQG